MAIYWQDYKNKEILVGDYTGLNPAEMIEQRLNLAAIIRQEKNPYWHLQNSEVL